MWYIWKNGFKDGSQAPIHFVHADDRIVSILGDRAAQDAVNFIASHVLPVNREGFGVVGFATDIVWTGVLDWAQHDFWVLTEQYLAVLFPGGPGNPKAAQFLLNYIDPIITANPTMVPERVMKHVQAFVHQNANLFQ